MNFNDCFKTAMAQTPDMEQIAMRRFGWYGERFIYFKPGTLDTDYAERFKYYHSIPVGYFRHMKDAAPKYPHFGIVYASGVRSNGWSPAHEDLIAEDWEIYEERSIDD